MTGLDDELARHAEAERERSYWQRLEKEFYARHVDMMEPTGELRALVEDFITRVRSRHWEAVWTGKGGGEELRLVTSAAERGVLGHLFPTRRRLLRDYGFSELEAICVYYSSSTEFSPMRESWITRDERVIWSAGCSDLVDLSEMRTACAAWLRGH